MDIAFAALEIAALPAADRKLITNMERAGS
jgi:hypothetical protein